MYGLEAFYHQKSPCHQQAHPYQKQLVQSPSGNQLDSDLELNVPLATTEIYLLATVSYRQADQNQVQNDNHLPESDQKALPQDNLRDQFLRINLVLRGRHFWLGFY